jgi:putative adenylate-forming enzyme
MGSKIAIARAYLAARFPRKPRRQAPEDTPVMGEAELIADFARFNALNLPLEEARRLARQELERGAPVHPDYSFGLSTGTTGEPGVFLTTQPERDRWLGTVLGKFLSPAQVWGLNAALLLKHNNRLYETSPRLHYFDLSQPAAHWASRLCGLQPNVVIGPPSVLLTLARSAAFLRRPVHPHTLLSVAEPLFPQDREALTRSFGVAPRNLYQAKEGFLAAGCTEGKLHWNEDLMVLEGMRFKGRPDRIVPVISDFTRQSQTFRRYRIDDVLLIGDICSCRTPHRKVTTVEGRLADVLLRPAPDGFRALFPLELNEHLRELGEYTLRQLTLDEFVLETASAPPTALLARLGEALGNPARIGLEPLHADMPGKKRRRLQRLFDPENLILLEQLLEPAAPLTP